APEEPAAIVIWSPAPRFIRNPGPAPVGFPNPASVVVGGPGCILIGLPHRAIAGNENPMTVAIKVLRAGVVRIGSMPALRVLNHVVAIFVPVVPIISAGSVIHFVLGVFRRPADDDAVTIFHAGAAL